MGLFRRKPSAEVATLRSELASLRMRLESSEATRADLESRVQRLDQASAAQASAVEQASAEATQRVEELRARIEAVPDRSVLDDLRRRVDDAAVEQRTLDELAERLARTANDASSTRELVGLLEARLAQVSTELANQVTELGREMDSLGSTGDDDERPSTSDGVVEQLRQGQVRLAGEQARYEIAFRQDLAALAEQIRLLRGR